MSERMEKPGVLQACLGTPQSLQQLIGYAPDSIVSKTVVDRPVGTITLFAFDRGQKLSEHTAPYDAVVQVIDGRARLTIGGQDKEVATGDLIIMPANVPHAVTASERFKMMLTMIRA
jgi:quercetin dioxygenase-like cupin family protein